MFYQVILNMLLKHIFISSLSIIISLALFQAEASSVVTRDIDCWLDPVLQPNKQQVVEVLEALETKKNPQQFETQEYGFTSKPSSWFDWQFLALIKGEREKSKDVRPRVLDLGCGLGNMATAILFAGGHVDAVDLKETVMQANTQIWSKTKGILGYEAAKSKQFYRCFPCDIKNPAQDQWTKEKHKYVLCRDVFHFFTESELIRLAAQLFDNVEEDGAVYIQVDTPTFAAECFNFYQQRKGKCLCPGLAVYNKVRGKNGLVLSGTPVALDETRHKVRPGQAYEDRFLENGSVKPDKHVYHTIRNVFMIEELAAIFEKAGFNPGPCFYLASDGRMLTNGELPEVGTISKACITLTKPRAIGIPEEISEEDLAMLYQTLGLRLIAPEKSK